MQSPAVGAAEVRETGSTVLRGVWPTDLLAELRTAISTFSERRAARVGSGAELERNERMYATHGVGTFGALVGAKLIDVDFLRRLFQGSHYQALCAAYFDDDACYASASRLGFRNHDPMRSDRSFIPYHQDSYTQDARVPHVLNCWMTLDSGAGRDAPGLEVVRQPCEPNFRRKDFGLRSENAAYDFITIDRQDIVDTYGDCFLAPEFEVGDGLVFSENVIHRTYVTPTMTRPRINFELRVFTPRCLAPGVSIADLGPQTIRIG